MIDEFNIDEIIDLTKLMEIVNARETKVFTVEDYVATKEKLGFEEWSGGFEIGDSALGMIPAEECLDELKGYKGEIQEVE